jgi:hypothetical protein
MKEILERLRMRKQYDESHLLNFSNISLHNLTDGFGSEDIHSQLPKHLILKYVLKYCMQNYWCKAIFQEELRFPLSFNMVILS